MIKLNKIIQILILVFIFLLPWQTRYIYHFAYLKGLYWEYGTLSIYVTEIMLWLIIFLSLIYLFLDPWFKEKITSVNSFKKRWWLFLVGAMIMWFNGYSASASLLPDVSWQFFSRLIGAICFFVLVSGWSYNHNKMMLVFWLGGLSQGILAIYQFLTQKISANKWLGISEQINYVSGVSVVQTETERWLRVYGSFGSPNSLGIYLALVLVVGFIYIFINRNTTPIVKKIIMIGQGIILIGLFFTFSRSAWLALVVGFIVLLIVFFKWKYIDFNLTWFIKNIFPFLILLSFFTTLYYPLLNTRFTGQVITEKISITDRWSQNKVALNIISQMPLTGTGLGLYTYHLFQYYPKPEYGSYEPVHNHYLLMTAEGGVLLSLLYLFLIAYLIIIIYRKRILYLSLPIMLLVYGLFDHYLWTMFTGQMIFWFIFALSLAKNTTNQN